MDFLSALMQHDDRALMPVKVPEWAAIMPEGGFFLKPITAKRRDELEQASWVDRGQGQVFDGTGVRSKLVAECLADKDGNLLLKPDDWGLIQEKSCSAVNRISSLASALNGMTAEELRAIEKN